MHEHFVSLSSFQNTTIWKYEIFSKKLRGFQTTSCKGPILREIFLTTKNKRLRVKQCVYKPMYNWHFFIQSTVLYKKGAQRMNRMSYWIVESSCEVRFCVFECGVVKCGVLKGIVISPVLFIKMSLWVWIWHPNTLKDLN